MIPDFYGDHIKHLQLNAKKSTDSELKHKYYTELYEELKDVSVLNKYYSYRQESAKFLINYYIKNKAFDKAIRIAEKWEKEYPYDFVGKFEYIYLLSIVDKDKAIKYFKIFYDKYNDIPKVRDEYTTFLIKYKMYNLGLKIGQKDNVTFQVFYNDNSENFSADQSKRYKSINYKRVNSKYDIKLSRLFKNLKGLRFDMDNISVGTIILDLNVTANGNKLNEVLNIHSLHHLKKDDFGYKIDGNDPSFELNLPKRLKNYSGKLDILFSIKIDTSNQELKSIINAPEWQIFSDTGNGFTIKESRNILLLKDNNKFSGNNRVDFTNVNRVRIDFPSLLSLKVNNFKLIINEKNIYDKKDIASYHNIENNKNNLEITGTDPFVIINLNNKDVKNYKIEIIFNEEENE